MNDRERAKALADEIAVKGLSWAPQGYRLDGPTEDIIVTALRAYATRPKPSGGLREVLRDHAIVPREPSEAAVNRAWMTACAATKVGAGDGGTYAVSVPTHASMRAALIEYGEKGNV